MNKNSKDYQEALSYFGQEQMKKFESEVETHFKKQKISPWKHLTKKSNIWKTYSFALTAFVGFQLCGELLKKPQANTVNLQTQASNTTSILETNGTFELPELTLPMPSENLQAFIVNDHSALADQLEVKQGDTLSTIAQRLLVQNNLKNTHKNRQRVIQELKTINTSIEKSDLIKAGWQLNAIDSETIKSLIVDL